MADMGGSDSPARIEDSKGEKTSWTPNIAALGSTGQLIRSRGAQGISLDKEIEEEDN